MTPDQWAQLTPDQRAAHITQHGPPPPGWAIGGYAAAPAKSRRKWPVVVGVLVALAVIIASCSGNRGTVGPQSSAGGAATAAPAAAPAKPAGPATTVGDGTYEVGTDMAAGRYKTAGPGGHGDLDICYWQRSKDDSGDFNKLISNDLFKGPGSVTVKAGEFVKLTGGCKWVKQ